MDPITAAAIAKLTAEIAKLTVEITVLKAKVFKIEKLTGI